MPDYKNTNNQVKELTDKLEQGIKDIFTSEKYKTYLKFLSRFHRYSTRNTALIYMQNPNATLVSGFRSWQSKFKRNVKKGEKGIKILAPTPFTIKKEEQKIDPDTKMPVLDRDGLPIVEEVEIHIPRFKVISVFDASQTEGKPLPTLVENLIGDVRYYDLFMTVLRDISLLPITIEAMPENMDGACYFGERIAIRQGMSEIQTISAIIHEITHAKLHDISITQETDESIPLKSTATKEVEAESISYTVCQYYGIETSPNSFGYLAAFGGREQKELAASLDLIRKTASDLIAIIDEKSQELAKERGIELTIQDAEKSTLPKEDSSISVTESAGDEVEKNHNQHSNNMEKEIKNIQSEDFDFSPDIVPDNTIKITDRDSYGYSDSTMLPLQKDRALDLFDDDQTIYMLYPDNKEAMVFDREEIITYAEMDKGIFGIAEGDWKMTAEYKNEMTRQHEHTKEASLLYGDAPTYGIYQLKKNLDLITPNHSSADRTNYELVYTSSLAGNMTLENLFAIHNSDERPAAQEMRSMSIGDIIVLQNKDSIQSFYVEKAGFKELLDFTGAETRPETPEQTYSQLENTTEYTGPSVAELDQRISDGQTISLQDLAKAVKNKQASISKSTKPSILAQIHTEKMNTGMIGDSEKSVSKSNIEH